MRFVLDGMFMKNTLKFVILSGYENYKGFTYSKSIANFGAVRWKISSSTNLIYFKRVFE